MEVPEDRLENILKIQYKRGRITSSLQGWGVESGKTYLKR